MPPSKHVRFVEGPALNTERLGFPEDFEAQGLGAHVARRARTTALRPRSTPPDEPAELRLPAP